MNRMEKINMNQNKETLDDNNHGSETNLCILYRTNNAKKSYSTFEQLIGANLVLSGH